jgi:hypothetical protein
LGPFAETEGSRLPGETSAQFLSFLRNSQPVSVAYFQRPVHTPNPAYPIQYKKGPRLRLYGTKILNRNPDEEEMIGVEFF